MNIKTTTIKKKALVLQMALGIITSFYGTALFGMNNEKNLNKKDVIALTESNSSNTSNSNINNNNNANNNNLLCQFGCGKICSKNSSLKNHETACANNKSKSDKQKCQYCDKLYAIYSLKRHENKCDKNRSENTNSTNAFSSNAVVMNTFFNNIFNENNTIQSYNPYNAEKVELTCKHCKNPYTKYGLKKHENNCD